MKIFVKSIEIEANHRLIEQIIKTESFWFIPLFARIWWKCFLSGKKGELPEDILLQITANMSTIGTVKINNGKCKLEYKKLESFNKSIFLKMGFLQHRIPKKAIKKPSKFEPQSPMRIDAGYLLYFRKPIIAPINEKDINIIS